MEGRQMATDSQQREAAVHQPVSPRAAHPRRPPAHKSVSLMHSPSRHKTITAARTHKRDRGTPASIQANPPSSLASKPQYQKDSSGEGSNAEKWFEASNNNVRNTSASLVANDPPFLLRNSSSSEPSPEGPSGDPMSTLDPQAYSLPCHPSNLMHMATMASSSEDYRSIIDDLTVQNKKLKRKLKKYERFENPDLQSHKVVELRTFNVPANKKRELEDMLKKFTMGLEESQTDESSSNGSERIPATLEPRKTTSPSHTSTRFGDSAYASMSASGNHSTAPSGQSALNTWKVPKSLIPSSISQQQRQHIQAYLHNIPAEQLSKSRPTVMSEKSKRKLVVRRLEQIFAGKTSTVGGHQQPLQQQEVAHSAARADRKAIEESGRRALEEGAREARIMPKVKGEQGASNEEVSPTEESLPVENKVSRQGFGEDPFEQRPTRPLDLDPYRAQVPAENINYIRHLGFSPQDVESTAPQADGHGWVYLNLLMNMAQIHTMNVTASFVRRSISELSLKLELSPDGRKVRWKGGIDVTRTSSNSSPEDGHGRNSAWSSLKTAPRKQSKLATAFSSNDGSSGNVSKSIRTLSNRKLAYTPLFFHQVESDDDMSEDGIASWSSPQAALVGGSSGFTSSGMRTSSSRKKRGDDGPIVFYNRANFCTDLSGDPRVKNLGLSNKLNYSRLATAPIGDPRESWSSPGKPFEKRGPLSHPQHAATESSDVDSKTPCEVQMEIDRPTKPCTEASSSEDSPNPIELEASGIGGVIPVDNFAIRVKARRQLDDQVDSMTSLRQQRSKLYPPDIRDIIAQGSGSDSTVVPPSREGRAVIKEQVISERRKELPPSELPPPSFFPFGSPDEYSEDSSSGSEAGEDLSNSAAALALHGPLPSAAPQVMNWPTYASGEESSPEEDEDTLEDDESDGSLDLLATARKVDPMAVQAKEREYDSHMAERLVEEIPAGSSAATAGGGSGFNSPDTPGEGEKEKTAGASEKPGLKRARTDESVPVQGGRTRKSPKLEA